MHSPVDLLTLIILRKNQRKIIKSHFNTFCFKSVAFVRRNLKMIVFLRIFVSDWNHVCLLGFHFGVNNHWIAMNTLWSWCILRASYKSQILTNLATVQESAIHKNWVDLICVHTVFPMSKDKFLWIGVLNFYIKTDREWQNKWTKQHFEFNEKTLASSFSKSSFTNISS